MSVFRRRPTEPAAPALETDPTRNSLPANPDAELPAPMGIPTFRPAAKEQTMNVPLKPGSPAPAPVGMPPRPAMPSPGGMPRVSPSERRTLVVGKGISLQGTVSDAERLVVEGTVESQMLTATELVISHAGVFKGEVQVEDAEIAGLFDGTITANGNLVIRATGRVLGSARCRRLQVEEGGQISGKMEMMGDAPVAAVRPPIPVALDA